MCIEPANISVGDFRRCKTTLVNLVSCHLPVPQVKPCLRKQAHGLRLPVPGTPTASHLVTDNKHAVHLGCRISWLHPPSFVKTQS